MAALVDEIMNRELFSVSPGEAAVDVREYIVDLGVTASPVLDDDGIPVGMVSLRDVVDLGDDTTTASDRMSAPVATVAEKAPISEAARLVSETGFHRLVAVDARGRAVGIVSAVDLVSALAGLPVRHPPVFPHFDKRLGLSWTDLLPLAMDRAEAAPDGPGILALVQTRPGRADRTVWVEASHNVRTRIIDMLSTPQGAGLRQWLEADHMAFRAAAVRDPDRRERALETLREQWKNPEHLPR